MSAEGKGNIVAQGMVRDLVNQFSDPYAFLRELVQNAIDAGSNRIDVSAEYLPGPDGAGTAVVRVEDDGGGMDEAVIDEFLLVLFKSSKEDDLTKIGKFGVGFLSVFAPKPFLVRVYTSKNLESWRLDFPDWRSYKKYKMPAPRDGTLVEVHKRATRAEYDELVARSLETVRYWCRHADTRIYFTDKAAGTPPLQVNEPFTLPAGESLRYAEEGTEIVLGFSPMGAAWGLSAEDANAMRAAYPGVDFDAEPFYGFYNRGLTLKEGRKIIIPGAELKIKSRYLEHTITRDNVLEDENYRKATGILARLGAKELPKRLRAELEGLAARLSKPELRADAAALRALEFEWLRRKRFLQLLCSSFMAGFRLDLDEWRILPTLGSGPVSPDDLRSAWKRLGAARARFAEKPAAYFSARRADAVTAAVERLGAPVLLDGEFCRYSVFLDWSGAAMAPLYARELLLAEEPGPGGLDARTAAFLKTAAVAGEACGRVYSGLVPAKFVYPDGPRGAEQPFVFRREPYGPGHRDEWTWVRDASGARAVVNCGHPFVKTLAGLHARRPGFAAFLLLKSMLLHADGSGDPAAEAGSSNLARRRERKLLAAALRLDGAAGRARG